MLCLSWYREENALKAMQIKDKIRKKMRNTMKKLIDEAKTKESLPENVVIEDENGI